MTKPNSLAFVLLLLTSTLSNCVSKKELPQAPWKSAMNQMADQLIDVAVLSADPLLEKDRAQIKSENSNVI